jgi:tetratricopeptide (TPR) repeat protein
VLYEQFAEVVPYARQVLRLLAPDQQQLRQTVTAQLGYALVWTGELAEAEATVSAMLKSLGDDAQPSGLHVLVWLLLGIVRFTQGRLRAAEDYFRQALDRITYNGQVLPSTTSTITLLELSRCAYERNNLAQAAAYAQRALALAQTIANPLYLAHSQAMCGLIAHSGGERGGLAQVQQALRQLQETPMNTSNNLFDLLSNERAIHR